MQTKLLNFLNNIILLLALSVLIMLFFYGCKNTENPVEQITEQTISDQEAVEVIALELSSEENPAGMTANCEAAAFIAANGEIPGNAGYYKSRDEVQFDTALVYDYNFPPYVYHFEVEYGYHFVKNGINYNFIFPGCDTLAADFASSGNYSQPLLNGTRYSTFPNLVLDGLNSLSVNYSANGVYTWNNKLTYANLVEKSFEVQGTMTLNGVTVNKSSYLVNGGSCSASITVSNLEGRSFTFNAAIIFKEDRTAEIQINSKVFVVDLETGEIIK